MRRAASGSSGLFSIGVLSLTVLAYAAAASVHTSGFIACYLAALVLGNMRLPHRSAVTAFADLDGVVRPDRALRAARAAGLAEQIDEQILPAIVIGLVLLLLARPLSVLVSIAPFRVPWRDQAFLSWAGLRGAVPVVLATVPLTVGAPDVDWIFDLVFVLVVIFTLVQGPTLPWVARGLGVVGLPQPSTWRWSPRPWRSLDAELIQVAVGPASRLHGVEVFEPAAPPGRERHPGRARWLGFVPAPNTAIRRGDQLLIVATAETKRKVERRVGGEPVRAARGLEDEA